MSIAEQTLETLEFPKIRAQLARYTAFSASHELALSLLPSTEFSAVAQRQQLTREARRLLDLHPDVTIGSARDIRGIVGHAARGGTLEAGVFLEIAATLESMRRLRGLLFKLDPEEFPLFGEIATDLPQLSSLEEEIAEIEDVFSGRSADLHPARERPAVGHGGLESRSVRDRPWIRADRRDERPFVTGMCSDG